MIKKEKKQEITHKNLLIISESFENDKKSISKHMTDLLKDLKKRGYCIDIITRTPLFILNSEVKSSVNCIDSISFGEIKFFDFFFRSRYFRYSLRFIEEFFFAIFIATKIFFKKKSYLFTLWYSPSIFIGFGIKLSFSKKKLGKKIMIIRDIFPEWLLDIGYLSKYSFSYLILSFFSKYQYIASDIILTQSQYDKNTIIKKTLNLRIMIDVLYSWYTIDPRKKINFKHFVTNTKRKYILHLGNIDLAQGINNNIGSILNLIKDNNHYDFVFIGLKDEIYKKFNSHKSKFNLTNLIISKPIDQKFIPNFCINATGGIFFLNKNLKTNNIPGRFVMYVLNGLRVFGVFKNNYELSKIINENDFGVCSFYDVSDFDLKFKKFLLNKKFKKRNIINNAKKIFSTKFAADKIINYIN